jgi:hypothetical protein
MSVYQVTYRRIATITMEQEVIVHVIADNPKGAVAQASKMIDKDKRGERGRELNWKDCDRLETKVEENSETLHGLTMEVELD